MMALFKLNWIVSHVSSRVSPLSRAQVNLDFPGVLRCARTKIRPVGKGFPKIKADGWWSKQSRTRLKLSLCLEDDACSMIPRSSNV